MTNKAKSLWFSAIVLSAVCASGAVHAQAYPSRAITVVVPYAAGGSTDVSARALADEMSKSLGATVVVENKPGAGGFIAATHVAKAPKDGYTLLYSNGGMTAINPNLYNKLPYSVSDFTPISGVVKFPYTVNANNNIPVKTVAELVAYAKSKPEGVTIGTVGLGTQTHLVSEWLGRALGFKVNAIHYKGTSQSSIDLIAGRIDFMIDGLSTAVTMHNADKLHIVASLGQERTSILPKGVETFTEAGHPELFSYADFGLMAPAGTPAEAIDKLHTAVVAALKSPSMVEKMEVRGEVAMPSATPADYGKFIAAETERWGAIIKPMGIKMD